MKKNIQAIDLYDSELTANACIEEESICPLCTKGISPQFLFAAVTKPKESSPYNITVINQCPVCKKIFMSHYLVLKYSLHAFKFDIDETELVRSEPQNYSDRKFRDSISKLSPRFTKIYNQAHFAETHGLDEISGIGYRKALEFLVKDFAISLNPTKENKVKSSTLSKCIESYIPGEKIQTLAKAATWLGNDETHYVQKHAEYTLDDLKSFINATVAFIDSELTYTEAQKLISNPK